MKSIIKKSLLYKSKVEYADFCINHVEGCAHGCMFPCYAFLIAKRFGKVKNYSEWIRPRLVANAIELLEREILHHSDQFLSLQFPQTDQRNRKFQKPLRFVGCRPLSYAN